MSQQTLFISDLHLQPNQPHITRLFLNFLKQWAPSADALYILGDFFEVWVGDDNHNEFNDTIEQALKQFTATGVRVYIMPGNRDFLLGKTFAKTTGSHLLSDPTWIDLYGVRTLLMHGDSLCTQDVKHQRFRRFSQHTITKKLFLTTPLWLRKMIARRLRQISSNRTQNMANNIMDVTPSAVIEMMEKYQTNQLIHGHTHRPQIHYFELANKPVKRIVLGAWHEQGSVLVCKPGAEPELKDVS